MYNISHLEIETTNTCQLKCIFCPRQKMKRQQGIMSNETFNTLINQIKDLQIKSCYLHDIGEPLLDQNLISRINEVKKYIPFVSISTNAMLLTEKMSRHLLTSSLSELTLALDSLNPEVYHHLRVGGNFNLVKSNIDKCLSIRKELENNSQCKVELQTIITIHNIKEVPDFKKEYGWLDNTKWGKLRIKEFSTFAGNVADLDPQNTEPRRFRCPKLFNSIGVHWNGDIIFCCRQYENSKPYLGNIHKDKLIDVFNSDLYNKMRIKMKHKDFSNELQFCKQC